MYSKKGKEKTYGKEINKKGFETSFKKTVVDHPDYGGGDDGTVNRKQSAKNTPSGY